MTILGIADADYVHTHKWANFFASRGHQVRLLSFRPVSSAGRQALSEEVKLEDWLLPALHLKRIWITVTALRRLRGLVRALQPDFVHAHFLGPSAWLAALAGCNPLVVTVMGGDVVGTRWSPRSRREQLLTPFTLSRTQLVVCWSANIRQLVRPMLPAGAQCEVVVGGVDRKLFYRRDAAARLREQLGLGGDAFVILSPRLLWPLYNIDTIVRSMPLILESVPQARLLLVRYKADQHPDYCRRIDRLLDELGIRSCVRVVPSIPNAEMPCYYSASDCTLSVPDSDGTPMTIMESLACETPVVINDILDYDPEWFVDFRTVLRVAPRDPTALGRAVVRLASDPDLREGLRVHGLEVVARHANYETEMGRLEELYRELVSRPA